MMMTRILKLLFVLPLWLAFADAAMAWTDPPGRVGRLSQIVGSATLRSADTPDGIAASVNWPVTDGDVISTDAASRAEIRIGSSVLRLDSSTEIAVSRIDDDNIRIWLEYGNVFVRVRSRDPANAVRVQTREGTAVAAEPGQYRIDTLDNGTVGLTAYEGRLRFEAEVGDATVNAGQRMEVWFANEIEFRTTAPVFDDFSAWSTALDRRDDGREPPRYVSREMTGVEDLQEYGDWDQDAAYGAVWYPRTVTVDWAPYRTGRWVWIDPWGWTWLDDAPWGFAPFHYGRWALIRGRWGWLPGSYVARPVYAPALVVWMGTPGLSVRFSTGHHPAVGWFPLAPREVYVPGYRCSTTYVRQVNITHVTNVKHIHEVVRAPERGRHAHRHVERAVTVVPTDTLVRGGPVARAVLPDRERWMREVAIAARPPVERERRFRPGGDRVRGSENLAERLHGDVRERGGRHERDRRDDGAPRHGFAPGRGGQERPLFQNDPETIAERLQGDRRERADHERRVHDEAARQLERRERQIGESGRRAGDGLAERIQQDGRRQAEEAERRAGDSLAERMHRDSRRAQDEAREQADRARIQIEREQFEAARQRESLAERMLQDSRRQQAEQVERIRIERRQAEEAERRTRDSLAERMRQDSRRAQEAAREQADRARIQIQREQLEAARQRESLAERMRQDSRRQQAEQMERMQADRARQERQQMEAMRRERESLAERIHQDSRRAQEQTDRARIQMQRQQFEQSQQRERSSSSLAERIRQDSRRQGGDGGGRGSVERMREMQQRQFEQVQRR